VPCGYGLPTPQDCAVVHWCPPTGAVREGAGWRGPCPASQCGTPRALEFSISGKSLRWNTFCAHHDRDALRPVLRALLGDCLPGRVRGPAPISHDALSVLALDMSLPPMTLRLRLLELAGMSTTSALDKLGVRPDNRGRVIAGRSGGPSKWTSRRR